MERDNQRNVTILDIGLSNVGSVKNMIDALNLDISCQIRTDPEYINDTNLLILPGVGHFEKAAEKADQLDLRRLIKNNLKRRNFQLLGICLGMQLLGETSAEGAGLGLGLIKGTTIPLKTISPNLKVPNMGWCDVAGLKNSIDDARFYHVHSYHFKPRTYSNVWLTTKLAGKEVVVGIKNDRVSGVQFHPEKSHRFGKLFFRRYLENAL